MCTILVIHDSPYALLGSAYSCVFMLQYTNVVFWCSTGTNIHRVSKIVLLLPAFSCLLFRAILVFFVANETKRNQTVKTVLHQNTKENEHLFKNFRLL